MSWQILVLSSLVSFTLAAINSPTKCELAIVRCCDTQKETRLPMRCFEVNGCPGIYWYGKRACSKSLVAAARSALNKSGKKSKKEITKVRRNKENNVPKTISKTNNVPKTISKTNNAPKPVSNLIPTKKETPPSSSFLPTACQLTIVRCCDVKQNTLLPLRCFEVNGCPGLYWHGRKACSKSLVNKAISSLNRKTRRKQKNNIYWEGQSNKGNCQGRKFCTVNFVRPRSFDSMFPLPPPYHPPKNKYKCKWS